MEEGINMEPKMEAKKGLRFFHARVFDSMLFDGKTHQLYEVTAVRSGMAYYRPVIRYDTREVLGSAAKCPVCDFHKYAMATNTPPAPGNTPAAGRHI